MNPGSVAVFDFFFFFLIHWLGPAGQISVLVTFCLILICISISSVHLISCSFFLHGHCLALVNSLVIYCVDLVCGAWPVPL